MIALAAVGGGCGLDLDGDEPNPDSIARQVAGPAPDYIATVVSDPPANAAIGANFPVTATVQNTGSAAAATESRTRYLLSADPLIGGDFEFAKTATVPPLGIAATDTQTLTLTVPRDLPAGDYFILACADRNKKIPELNEGNNCGASAGTVALDGPDLVVSSVADPPASAVPNTSFSVSETTANTGGLASGRSVTRFLLSLDTQRGADVPIIGERRVPPVAAAASSTAPTQLILEWSTPPGTYFLLACADYRNAVAELSEQNNCTVAAGQVIVTGPICGDGIYGPGEECEDGNVQDGDGCDSNCTRTGCGNGVLTGGETCDDGNFESGDGCDYNCTPTACGNGVTSEGEECDDGNLEDGDGCDSTCVYTACGNGILTGGEDCDDGNLVDEDGCDSNCTFTGCGNGVLTTGESCDDGNSLDGDGCDSNCTFTGCGNGIMTRGEWCDDGNDADGDGCEADCTVTGCGDGLVGGTEECDDGNDVEGDGCDSNCTSTECGNGIVTSAEVCDDRNLADDDGCDADCEPSTVVQVVTGAAHTCVLTRKGGVRCWGTSEFGQLGYGNTDTIGDDETPASIGTVAVGGTAVQLSAGTFHTCALLDTGRVRCWGAGWNGMLGYGSTDPIGDDETPASAGDVDVGGTVVQVGAGGVHTCALLDTGAVRCWGAGYTGALGYGNISDIGDDEPPASAGDIDVGATVVQIAVGIVHACALLDTGDVRCWGTSTSGQLGYANTDTIGDNEIPAAAGPIYLGGAVAELAAGWMHNCALMETGDVRCWGHGEDGRLGYASMNNIGDHYDPVHMGTVDVGGTVAHVYPGGTATCAVLDSGSVRCWGLGWTDQLGYGNGENIGDTETPASAGDVDMGGIAVQVATGTYHTCAVMVTGGVRCWGLSLLPYGNFDSVQIPSSVGEAPLFPFIP